MRVTWPALVWRNLRRRPVRSALTSAGVAVGVALIVALLSITAGAKATADDLVHVGRADFGLFQRGASDLTLSRLPEALIGQIADEPGVAGAAGVYLFQTKSLVVFGFQSGDFTQRRLVLVSGRRPSGDQAYVGDIAADRLHLKPGSTLTVGRREFPVSGVYHIGNSVVDDGTVLPLQTVQELAQRPRDVTTIVVTASLGADPRKVARRIEDDFPGTISVVDPDQAVKIDTSSRLITTTGWIISALALLLAGSAVTNTMAMSVFERMREIGVLRAVGWPNRRIAALILSEAVALCLIALALGLLLGYGSAELFTSGGDALDLLEPDFTGGVFAWGLAFALGVALVGAIYPTWIATRLRPIEALRQE
jgi:putative ABC transport system permease protein